MPQRSARSTTPLAALTSALVLASGALLAAAPAHAADDPAPARPIIYRWVDENGVPHYTAQRGRVPSGLRDRVTELQPSAAGAGDAAPDRWIGHDAGAPPAPQPNATATPGEPGGTPQDTRAGAPSASAKIERSPGAANATSSPAAGEPSRAGGDASGLDAQIAALEGEVARDEAALQDLLSDAPAGAPSIADRPAFREIARRLPKRQADLRSLRDQRSRLGRP